MRFVLLAIAEYADRTGYAFPTVEAVARRALFTRQHTGKTISALISAGWMTPCKHPKEHRSKAYRIDLKRLASCNPQLHDDSQSHVIVDATSCNPQLHENAPKDVDLAGSHVIVDPISCHPGRKPPTPPLKVEPPLTASKNKRPSPAQKTSPDSRFTPFRESFSNYFQLKNGKPAPWIAQEAAQLKRWLAANPSYTHEEWVHLLNNRARSPVVHAKPLSAWIKLATAWLNGLADDWGKPITGGNKNGNGNYTKAGRTVSAAQALIAEIENRAGADRDGGDAGRGVEPGGFEAVHGKTIEGKR